MPFQPQTNAILPALISQGFTNSSNLQMQGSEAMSSGISSAGASISDAIVKLGEKLEKDAMANSSASGVVQGLAPYTKSGIISQADLDKLGSIKNPYERLGYAQTLAETSAKVHGGMLQAQQIAAYGQRQQAGFQNTQQQNAPTQPNPSFQPVGGSWNNVR